jgi:hypothetical protein
VCGVSNIRKKKIHTAESLVSCPSPSDVDIAIAKTKKHNKASCSDEMIAELLEAEGKVLRSNIYKVINSV